MDTTIIKAEVTDRLGNALVSDDPVAELKELSIQLTFQTNRVMRALVKAEDVPDLPEDDDEQDAENDESDHIYDPYAFADGH